jgi:hypothetical protein
MSAERTLGAATPATLHGLGLHRYRRRGLLRQVLDQ